MGSSTGYGYINARIHGMKRFFLQKTIYEKILSVSSIYELIAVLRTTAYRISLELELLSGEDVNTIDRALIRHLTTLCTKILNFTKGEPHQLFQLLFWRWQVENHKLLTYKILADKTEKGNWTTKIIPINNYGVADIEILDSIKTLQQFQDWLTTKQSPFIEVVRSLRMEYHTELHAEIVESAYDRFYFRHIMTNLKSLRNKKATRVFKDMINAEIAFKNTQMTLKLLGLFTRDRIPPKLVIPGLFIPNKTDKFVSKLINAFQTGKINEAYTIFRKSQVGRSLPLTFSKETVRTRLEVLDREIEMEFIRSQIQRAKKNFQGVGLGLAFFWQLIAEIRNLRFLTQVVVSDFPREDARRFLIIE